MKLELKHLAPYLPYKLKVVEWYRGKQIHDEFIVDCVNWDGKNIGGSNASLDSFELERAFNLRDVKPILRPISSMTKEEAKEFSKLALSHCMKDDSSLLDLDVKTDKVSGTTISCSFSEIMFNYIHTVTTYSICVCGDFIKIMDKETDQVVSVSYSLYEWLFKNHFDVFGLIGDNLAIEKRDEQF